MKFWLRNISKIKNFLGDLLTSLPSSGEGNNQNKKFLIS